MFGSYSRPPEEGGDRSVTGLTPRHLAAARLGLGRLPLVVLQPMVDIATAIMTRRHPGLVAPLAELGPKTVLIEATDLPVAFLLRADPGGPRVRCVRPSSAIRASARICGTLETLVGLLEGRIDGDAAFFTRDLSVSGDTSAVLIVRNTLDGAGLDVVAEVKAVLGPLAKPALRLIDRAGGVVETLGAGPHRRPATAAPDPAPHGRTVTPSGGDTP